MRRFLSPFLCLPNDERGVTALEYGMMAALIALVIVGAVTRLGTKVLALWTSVAGMNL